MIALLVGKKLFSSSFKKEGLIILGVIGTFLMLPVIALVSLTDVGSLVDSNLKLYTGPASTTNTYTFGYCTFWAAKRREEVGKPIPNNWGDAHTWDDGAKAAGYLVDHTPTQYAIMETDAGDLGHVAFVESVAPDGTWKITQMNAPGWDIVSEKTYTATDAQRFNFIH
jgi:surface antigen